MSNTPNFKPTKSRRVTKKGRALAENAAHDLFVLTHGSGEDRLSSGMKWYECATRARHWWDTKGAREMRLNNMRQELPIGSRADVQTNGAAFASQDPDSPNFLPSSILAGEPWESLDDLEKARLCQTWHHFNIVSPDMLGEDTEEIYKLTPEGRVN